MVVEQHEASLWAKSLRRGTVGILAALLLLACGMILAQPVHAESNFIIEDYDIQMQVNEDDTYLITETVDVHFTASSHGIYRAIPYKITLYRDDQKDVFYGRVKDFRMLSGQPVDKIKGDETWYFKIGDPHKFADDDTTYQYSYIFDPRGDHLRGADEVYYNLVGTTWEAQSIDHVSFEIDFPKKFDTTKVGIKTGYDVAVPFKTKKDRVIYGDTNEDVLAGLTIRAILPEGYFTKQASSSNMLFYILIGLIAIATGWGVLLWRKYGRDPDIVETEEFYPPDGLSAPEVAYLEKGGLEGKSITGMLLTLADKGYLKISEKEVHYGIKNKKTKTEYEITKLKEYDGNSEDEELFMEGLFEDIRTTTVDMSDLKNKFYKTVNEIKKNIEDRYADQLYDSKADNYAFLLRAIGTAGVIALFLGSKILNGSPFIVGNGDTFIYLVFDALEVILPLVGFYGISKWINKPQKSVLKFILGFIGWALLILLGFGLAVLCDTCMGGQIVPYFLGLMMTFLLFVMAALCERKTDDYAELLGKIRGYKRFLQVAEKDRMEMLAEQDPDYFYKNLAYAFALGVTAVYAKHFASLATEPPRWFDSAYYTTGMVFNSTNMMSSMDSMMSSVSSTMVSSPSSSGSGGGGSFSGGGGMGGGGGGSW